MRSTNAVASRARRKKILKQTKGMQKAPRTSYKLGKQAVTRAGQYAYRDRRVKKREFRKLWIKRINNGVRIADPEMTYSKFIAGLNKAGVKIDRKVMADLAVNEPKALAELVAIAKK